MTAQTFGVFLVWAQRLPATTLLNLCVDLTGDLKAGLMLSRTLFWLVSPQRRRSDASALPVLKDGRRWLVRADADWWAETRLSVREARAARLHPEFA